MNLFRCTPDGSLDRQYLRVCAVYKLLIVKKCIDKTRAAGLLAQSKVAYPVRLIDLWLGNQRKEFAS